MARMNRLFGVTMAERGVSQLVSVQLEEAVKILDQNVAWGYAPAAPTADIIIRHRVGAGAPPDDRLQRMIQYAVPPVRILNVSDYWMPRMSGAW